jgi:hypothetical protein
MRKLFCTFLIVLLAAAAALADRTRTWQQSRFDDFQKGTSRGVAILSGGELELAPGFRAIYTSPSTYIWAVAADKVGNVYAAAGSPARLYRYGADGSARVVFDPAELQIQALAMDPATGVLYAGTSPDGKVYKLEPKTPPPAPARRRGRTPAAPAQPEPAQPEPEEQELKADADETAFTSSVFFDPQTKYIWDLALDNEGRLYVATGDRGEVFRVNRNGESSLFFKSDEAHIRVLAFDGAGNLIAGSDGSGLVYRISPAGEAFVLYSAAKKEITALAIDPEGNIYAAGVGEKRTPSRVPPATVAPPQQPQPTVTVTVQGPGSTQAQPQPQQAQPAQPAMPPAPLASGGSEIYRIAADGAPRRIWDSREDIVYALTFDPQGRLLVGTGNKGRIFTVADDGSYTDLLKASATHVTAFARAPNGGLYASTSNLGKLFLMDVAPAAEATFDSDVFDARIFSRWGRAQVRGSGSYDFYARSGNVDNPDRNWSPWKKVDLENDASVNVPPARFIQWRAVLRPSNHLTRLESVSLFYRPDNVAPVIDDVTVAVGARFASAQQGRPQQSETVVISPGGVTAPAQQSPQRADGPMPAVRDRNFIAARWTASDENDDDLVYTLYYRGDNETRWKLLADNVTDRFYSWDAGLLPDGGYTLRVVASDAPSNPAGEALATERLSARFEVDNTPPRVENLHAVFEGDGIRVSFRAADTFSPIRRAEYSIDAGPWQLVEPVNQLSDSQVERYDFAVTPPGERRRMPVAAGVPAPDAAGAEHTIVVRVYDRFDNMGTGKVVLRSQ